MKRTLLALAISILTATAAGSATVSNVTFLQRGGTKLVDIEYDLVGAATETAVIEVKYSLDGGVDGFPHRAQTATGDIGVGVTMGTGKSLVWNAGADEPDVQTSNLIIRVCAQEPTMTVMLPGNVPLVLVYCPAGSFSMGSDDPGWSDSEEQPVHTVNAPSLYMGKYEVTQAQWQAVMGSNPSYFPACGDTCPVESVSWNDCQTFITDLNAHITSTGQGPATFRLPSEAEWEYACRAGTTTRFWSGGGSDCSPTVCTPCELDAYAWWCGNDTLTGTKPVGGKLPNPWGLFDMHGSVWEWCEDDYHSSYTGAPSDGSAWVNSPRASDRVIRGGSRNNNARNCRSANRLNYDPSDRRNNIGLRLAAVR